MKQILLLAAITLIALTSCGSRGNKKTSENTKVETTAQVSNPSTVYVYYFHGKQRCKTCIAVGNVGIVI